jgi:predicted MFS family arabinose efflux permease
MDRRLYFLTLGNVVIGTGTMVMSGILDPIARDLNVSVSAAGQVTTVYALAFALGAPVIAALTGGFDRTRVLALALLGFALSGFLSALAPNYATLMGARVLGGLSAAAFSPTAVAVAASLVPPAQRGRAIALVFGGMTIASVLGVPLGTWIGLAVGWREMLMGLSLLSLVAVAALWVGVPRGLYLPAATLGRWGLALRHPVVVILLGVTAFQIGGSFVLFAFFGPYLAEVTGLSRDGIATILFVFGLASLIGNFAAGWAVDRFGAARVTHASIALTALSLAALMGTAGAPVAAGLAITLWGATVFGINTAQQARLVEAAPELTTVVLPANSSILFAGQAMGAGLGGVLLGLGGLSLLPLAGALVVLVALGLSVLGARGMRPVAP